MDKRESALVGALMFDPSMIPLIATEVPPSSFLDVSARAVFEAMLAVQRSGVEPEPTNVADELERRGVLAVVGGCVAVRALVEESPELREALDALLQLRLRLPPVEEERVVQLACRVLEAESLGE